MRKRKIFSILGGEFKLLHGVNIRGFTFSEVRPLFLTMPYKSQKQAAFFNANKKKLEKQGVNVDEWNRKSKGKKLPKMAKKKK